MILTVDAPRNIVPYHYGLLSLISFRRLSSVAQQLHALLSSLLSLVVAPCLQQGRAGLHKCRPLKKKTAGIFHRRVKCLSVGSALKNFSILSSTNRFNVAGQIFLLLPIILKLESYALYVHVILIVLIQWKKSPFQSQVMLFYLMSDR